MKESESADISSDFVTCEVDDTTCSVCYAEFLDPEDLDLHIQQVHPSLPSGNLVKCQFCEKRFADAETYVLHIRDDHLLDFKSCSICYRIFTSNYELKKHEMKHPLSMREGTFACSQCDQFFMYKSELLLHELDSHYDSEEGVFLNKQYALLSSVINIKAETFIRSIGSDKDGKNFTYICTCCKHRTMDLEAYILHLKKNNCRSPVCDKCFNAYHKRASLFYHVSHHPNCDIVKERFKEKKQSGQCSKCKGYFDRKSMKRHSCVPNIKCSDCNIEFDNMYELSEHQSRVHPVALALVMCKFCRKECVGPDALEKHIQRSHEHELHLYKYTCTYCDTTFKHPRRLFAHYLLKHKDIEPYLCKICDKKFRVRKGFTLHIKLQHKSEGFVEFDEKLHVFFTDKKSEKPFQPLSKYVLDKPAEGDYDSKDEEETSSTSKQMETTSKTKENEMTSKSQKSETSSKSQENETSSKSQEKETSRKSQEHETSSKSQQIETSKSREKETSCKHTEKETPNQSIDKETSSKSKELRSADIDSNETEQNKNDGEGTGVRKRKNTIEVDDILALSDYDSDDEPLLLVKKKAKLKLRLRSKPLRMKKRRMKNAKKQFTCEICKKYCYTFQNYQNHVNLHFRDVTKKCIKCSLAFKTKADLERHMTDQHSSSQLTETLKTILERRKKGQQKQDISDTVKFLNTIKKVQFEKDDVTATLSPITKEMSVQKFIEDFRPEEGEKSNNVVNSITITKVTKPVGKEPVIKMTKFKPAPEIESHIKLAMPVRFKNCNETHSISVRRVQTRDVPTNILFTYDDGNQFQDDNNYNDDNDYKDDNDYNDDTKDANIPEVEQEVTLEGTDDVPKKKPTTHKIIIPKLPKELKSIRIAHLLPEAPYYKIVKMDDIIKTHQEKEPVEDDNVKEVTEAVRLPDGTKLVHVNPLAHLLGNRPVEQILKPNKYYKYKPKAKNFEEVLAKALRKLDIPNKQVKKKKEPNKNKEEFIILDKDLNEVKEVNDSDIVNSSGNEIVPDGNEVAEETSTEENATSDLVETA